MTVAVCTRDRPEMLADTLNALIAQAEPITEIVVVDQGRQRPARVPAADSGPPIVVIRDRGEGLSRARNLAVQRATTSWVAFLDDDCLPDPDWAQSLARACAEHLTAELVSGPVRAGYLPHGDLRAVGVRTVNRTGLRSGGWTPPLAIGHGASFAVRREVVQRLGGWDERLGAGTRPFPAGEDSDFNYRFLRSGGVAYVTSQPGVTHRQWRTEPELAKLHAGYLAGNSGCAIKHLRTGDKAGGVWLWMRLAGGVAYMFAGAIRNRSALHWRLAIAQACGFATGTAAGFRQAW
jgi:GT2 family glycosyltransferase